jgi:DNA-binding winged helix-turn-helix (wHTH) protein/tetratricopeptide (TPR) repeat protein
MAAPGGRGLSFGEFRLDRVEGCLWRGDVEVPLRAKSLAVLRHLAENPGRLVTRDELLRAVWPGVAVSASVVRVSIAEVRAALGDDSLAPRFVDTVGRKGYRFLAGTDERPTGERRFVGRRDDLARLHRHLARCRDLHRTVVFVAGEVGIGKTTLVERFTEEVRRTGGRVATGQCVELHGPVEPYLPVLELLGSLCRDGGRNDVVAVLSRWAPSWLLQMPGVVDAAGMEALRRRVPAPTRERMLRELADALDVLAKEEPLVVVVEDLHWSDASTVDLLRYVAERTTPSRLLVIGTYRPAELVVREHPMRGAAQQLVGRGRASELLLELLSPDDVRAYVAARLGGEPFDPSLPELLCRRTDGNPLFLTGVMDHLLDRGLLARQDGAWRLTAAPDTSVPQSLRDLVAQKAEGLGPDERAVLAAASVAGVEFDALVVAAGSDLPVEAVERICGGLAARGQLVCTAGTVSWPDGSFAGTYEFLHGLFQTVIYQQLAPADRSRLHRAIAERIETGYGSDGARVAAVIASHFERGGDWPRAVRHHLAAVSAAKDRLAEREVVAHCEATLSLLPRLPASRERDEIEMTCSLDLGASLLAVRGYGVPEVEPHFVRARDLAVGLELPPTEILARGGLFAYHVMRGDHRRAVEVADDLLALADRFPIPLFVMIGHTTLGSVHYNLGHLVQAREHFARARAAWEPGFPRLQLDQKVIFLGIGALVLHQLGETQAADALAVELIDYAAGLGDPLNVAHTYHLMCQYRVLAGDREGAVEWADRAIAVAAEHGFAMHEAGARATRAFATGDLDAQRAGYAVRADNGQRVGDPMYRMGMATTLLDRGAVTEAAGELARAFAFVAEMGEVRHLAELHRLRAACASREGHADDAEADLRTALAVASDQSSRLFTLRAAADLAELLRDHGRADEGRALLAPLLAGFVPDAQGPELVRVRTLAASLA